MNKKVFYPRSDDGVVGIREAERDKDGGDRVDPSVLVRKYVGDRIGHGLPHQGSHNAGELVASCRHLFARGIYGLAVRQPPTN
jgi:hypothetical protein